jgi:hypothetical protein
MRKKKLVSIILSGVFFVQGMMYVNHYSYGYHVDEVKEDLERLEAIVSGKAELKENLSASVLGAVGAEYKSNEAELLNLSKRILSSTEHAIENADDLKKVQQLELALSEINHIQEKSLLLFEDALKAAEEKDVLDELKDIHSKANHLKTDVNHASDQIQQALQNGKKSLELDIKTSKEKHHHSKSHAKASDESHDHEVIETDESDLLSREIKVVDNASRREKEKQDDAIEREANRKRIMLIEQGKSAQKSEALKSKMQKLQAERQERERALH